MNETLPGWRTGATPHQDIRDNHVSEALFAVNLSRAMARKGADEYRDPGLFFERTHLTRTLQSLIRDVLDTLRGKPGGNSVIHLQTNFGGGKTHAELALYHLLTSPDQALQSPRLARLLADSGPDSVPRAAIAALPCADLYAGGREVEGGPTISTLWGELAYRLGGAKLYQLVRASDEQRLAPGVDQLRNVLTQAGPNLILIDELLHYVDKAAAVKVGDSNLATQTLGFLRELTEAVDAVGHSVLVASLTASRMEDLQILTGEDAQLTLAKMEDILRRVEDSRTPIEGSEIYDIIRTRLFETVNEHLADEVSVAYFQFYRSDPWRDLLPQESRDVGYEELLRKAYPLHPSIVQVLYERWGSRPQFQLTRGTLRFLSHLLAYLWNAGDTGRAMGPLIHLSDVDLSDEDLRAETLRVAGSEWEAIIGTDVAAAQKGVDSNSQLVDKRHGGLYQRLRLTQGIATSVFMFTQGGLQTRPTPHTEIRLAVTRPGIPFPDLKQAVDDCRARLYYYYEEDGGLIFRTQPNPNKVLADERANVTTDDARDKVETVVEQVVGKSELLHVSRFGFKDGRAKEPGDVPDDGQLQLVVLPPRLNVGRGTLVGRTAAAIDEITEHYGNKLRMNRNMVLYLVAHSDHISGAIDRAMDWLAAERIIGDAGLMARFSEPQRDMIVSSATSAENDTKDHVRKAYNTVVLPSGSGTYERFELSYVPPNKTVLAQAEDELLTRRKLHREFNPALLDDRWSSLWPKTATVITAAALWEKFARQGGAPILTGVEVVQDMIRQAVERELFGYGLLHDSDQDKLKRSSYERIFFGPFDARELQEVEVSGRAVLLRPEQVYTLHPPITKEEVVMLLHGPRQSVESAFSAARKSLTVEGRVDKRAFFDAIFEGVKAGLFGYADALDGTIERGAESELSAEDIKFSGLLIGEDVPLPVTAEEVVRLVPAGGAFGVEELYQKALVTYGEERVSKQGLLGVVQRCVAEGRIGYSASQAETVRLGPQAVSLDGYVGFPAALPPDTRVVRLSGSVSSVEFANVVKAAMNLSKLGESSITLELQVQLKGKVDDHAVSVALNELKSRVPSLKVEDRKGD